MAELAPPAVIQYRMRWRRLMLALAAGSILAQAPGLAAAADGIAEYTAEYEVRYKGRRVANAEFGVTAGTDEYVFASSTRARGLLRLASPNPAIERSRFRVTADGIAPLGFEYEDGSRSGEDNYSLVFDAAGGEIHLTTAAGPSTLPYEADLLDRGSLQVALMRDLAACREPGPYRYVDDGGVKTYRYERLDDQSVETGIGTLDTIRFAQQREGSSRRTVLSLAPELGFVPARIEQIRDGEIETVFSLEDIAGIEREPAGCSGFR